MMKFLIALLQAKPSMYLRHEIPNLLGAQFFYSLMLYLHRVVRFPARKPEKYRKILAQLKTEGAVVIENFFSEAEHKSIETEYRKTTPRFKLQQAAAPLPHVSSLEIHSEFISDEVKNLFVRNPFFDELATAFLNRKYHFPIQGFFMRIFCDRSEADLPTNGGTNNIHFDAPTRTLKYFYYVTDTNEKNAVLTYYKGSNRRTLERMLFEYRLSVRYAQNARNPNHRGQYRDGEPWVIITDEEMRARGFTESFISGKANTLVIADVGGFHRRGSFPAGGVRETVEINYRSIETLRNDLYPLEMFLRKVFNKPLKKQTNVSEY